MSDAANRAAPPEKILDLRYFLFFCAGCCLISPFIMFISMSEYWLFLFGSKALGSVTWVLMAPLPPMALLAAKLAARFSIRARLRVAWGGQVLLSALTVAVALGYSRLRGPNEPPWAFALFLALFLAVVFVSSLLYAVAQATFLSFCALFPSHNAQAIYTGMTLTRLFFNCVWLLLALTTDYSSGQALQLLLLNGLVVALMVAALFLYSRLRRGADESTLKERKDKVSFAELRAAAAKIKWRLVQYIVLMAVRFSLYPTLLFGYRASDPRLQKQWGSVLNVITSFFGVFAKLFSHRLPLGMGLVFSADAIGTSLGVISAVSVAALLPLWLMQTGNLGVRPIVAPWVDAAVVIFYIFQSFCSGLIFNKLMEVALNEVDKNEKQIVSPILMFSYVSGGFIGSLIGFLVNLAK